MAPPLVLIFVLARYAGPEAPAAGQYQDSGALRISVDVARVVLHATVTGRDGSFVSNLDQRDFEVREDGVPQRIQVFRNEDVPVTVGLVIDHSATMRRKLSEVIAAVLTFARFSNLDNEMFVVNFAEKVSLGLPDTIPFTDSTAELENAIRTGPAGGQPALYDAIAMALEELPAGSRDKKALIVISGGCDNASEHSLAQVMKLAGQSNAVIYTVGVFGDNDPDRNPGVLQRLARETGGEAYLPGQLSEVMAICERIARDLRHQYTLGYVPLQPAHSGGYHTVRVRARAGNGEGLTVRTRSGYVVATAPLHTKKGGNSWRAH